MLRGYHSINIFNDYMLIQLKIILNNLLINRRKECVYYLSYFIEIRDFITSIKFYRPFSYLTLLAWRIYPSLNPWHNVFNLLERSLNIGYCAPIHNIKLQLKKRHVICWLSQWFNWYKLWTLLYLTIDFLNIDNFCYECMISTLRNLYLLLGNILSLIIFFAKILLKVNCCRSKFKKYVLFLLNLFEGQRKQFIIFLLMVKMLTHLVLLLLVKTIFN